MQTFSSDREKIFIEGKIDSSIRIVCGNFEIEEFSGSIPQKLALDSNVIKKDIDLIGLIINILEVFYMNKSVQQALERGFIRETAHSGEIAQ